MLSFFAKPPSLTLVDFKVENYKRLDEALKSYKNILCNDAKHSTVFSNHSQELFNIRNKLSQLITGKTDIDTQIREIEALSTLVDHTNRLLEFINIDENEGRFIIYNKYIFNLQSFNSMLRKQQDDILLSLDKFIPECKIFHNRVSQFIVDEELKEETSIDDILLLSNFIKALANAIEDPKKPGTLRELLKYAKEIHNRSNSLKNVSLREIARSALTVTSYVCTLIGVASLFFPPLMGLGMWLMSPAMLFMLMAHSIPHSKKSAREELASSIVNINYYARIFSSQLNATQSSASATVQTQPPERSTYQVT